LRNEAQRRTNTGDTEPPGSSHHHEGKVYIAAAWFGYWGKGTAAALRVLREKEE
jgi:hypothetical protein